MEWRGGLRWVGLRGLAMLESDLDPSSDVPHESRASRDCEEGGAWQLCHHLQGQSFGFEDAKFFFFSVTGFRTLCPHQDLMSVIRFISSTELI